MLGTTINSVFTWGNAKAWLAGIFLTLSQLKANPEGILDAVTNAGSLGEAGVVGALGAMVVWGWRNGDTT